jgi:hypothetical protein
MILSRAPTRASSLLATAAVDNRLRASPVVSAVSLSGEAMISMSTSSSEKQPADIEFYSPIPSICVVVARLMEVEPEKDRP